MITLTITGEETGLPLEERLQLTGADSPLMQVLSRAAANVLTAHYRQRQQTPNKKGWPRQNFWRILKDTPQKREKAGQSWEWGVWWGHGACTMAGPVEGFGA